MHKIDHIAVGVDFSRQSEVAFCEAVDLAEAHDAMLTVIHVAELFPNYGDLSGLSLDWSGLHDAVQKSRGDELAEYLSELDTRDVRVERAILIGDVEPSIAAFVADNDVDLVVLSATGKGAFERTLLGTTAENVAQQSKVPVWIARPRPGVPMRRILVGTDFSDASKAAVAFAARLAQPTSALIEVVHVVPDHRDSGLLMLKGAMANDLEKQLVAKAEEELKAMVESVGDPGEARIEGKVLHGRSWRRIIEHAEDGRFDIICLGVQRDSLMDLVVWRSTAVSVVRHALHDVVLVHEA